MQVNFSPLEIFVVYGMTAGWVLFIFHLGGGGGGVLTHSL